MVPGCHPSHMIWQGSTTSQAADPTIEPEEMP
jgi:hypothetical protein